MGLSLHFSKYKKKSSGCCGATSIEDHVHDSSKGEHCSTCPSQNEKENSLHEALAEIKKTN